MKFVIPFLFAPDEAVAAAPEGETAPAVDSPQPPPVAETAPAVEPEAAPEATTDDAPVESGPPPWAKSLETRFEDPAVRAQVDEYLRTEHQPYLTRIEQERKDALDKSWVFDELNDDPAAALQTIAEQIWGEEKATAIVALVKDGETLEDATAIVEEAEEAETDGEDTLDLSKLPKAVRDAVEFAEAQKATQAAEAEAAAKAEGEAAYKSWLDATTAANPDIVEADLHAYAYAAGGDLEAALASYRTAHPKPEPPKPAASPTLTGGHTTGGIQPTRPHTSLGEAFGAVYDGAAGTAA